MIDSDLAQLYGVERRVLNQAVKRNIDRFFDISGGYYGWPTATVLRHCPFGAHSIDFIEKMIKPME